jgi:hypothetical protein
MGTHNALLRLGEHSYLEVIAVDPDGIPPGRPRWFALDDPSMQSRLAAGPSLITWALRCESLATACARVPDLGEILSMPRDFAGRSFARMVPAQRVPGGMSGAGATGEPLHLRCLPTADATCWPDLMHPAAVLGTRHQTMFRELA